MSSQAEQLQQVMNFFTLKGGAVMAAAPASKPHARSGNVRLRASAPRVMAGAVSQEAVDEAHFTRF
jgi:hypothetical protein